MRTRTSRLLPLLFVGIIHLPALATANEAPPRLTWRVENPFPLIKSAKHVQYLSRGLEALEQQKDFALYSEAVLGAYAETQWNRKDRTYDRDFVHSKREFVVVKLDDVAEGATCTWKGTSMSSTSTCQDEQRVEIDTAASKNLEVFIEQNQAVSSFTYSIAPKERLIVGLGDSFSSGEGNPDRPFRWRPEQISERAASGFRRDWALSATYNEKDLADWQDVSCHRSLYSWQFLYALKQSTRDPHTIVKFVPFACSGAEIYDGLLVRQVVSNPNDKDPYKAPDSQINEAVKLLCTEPSQSKSQGSLEQIRTSTLHEVKVNHCAPEKLKRPDEVLLTIGGNDIAFSGLIAWTSFPERGYTWLTSELGVKYVNQALTPESNMACPTQTSLNDERCKGRFSADQAFTQNWLGDNIRLSHQIIEEVLQPSRLLQLNYPSPTRDEAGKICDFGPSSDASRALKNELFRVIDEKAPNRMVDMTYPNYSVGPLTIKVAEVENQTVAKLQRTILNSASEHVQMRDISAPFRTHGFCARQGRYELELSTTHGQSPRGYWWPRKPWEINPWEMTARWFRTPNDALMTQYADSRFSNEAWKYGMFHPNQLGHLSMYKSALQGD